jgi:Trk K+ transport system NAD-binding subunit
MWKVDSWALRRWAKIDIVDYHRLLRLAGDYSVYKMHITAQHWMAGRSLAELALPTEGILVLGIEGAEDSYYGAPRGSTRIEPGDWLVLYGRQETLQDLEMREAGLEGNMHHVMAVTRQLDVAEEERHRLKHGE